MPGHLWAPWRLKYIEADSGRPKDAGCIFVELPNQDNDEENLILHRGEHAFVIMNRYPYTNGHLMVAPYRHTADLGELSDAELLEIHQLVVKCTQWITRAYRPQGFNVGVNLGAAAGAGIPDHVHWHIVPRWSGDTNFMTTVGDVRVMPQSLAESYSRLMSAKHASE